MKRMLFDELARSMEQALEHAQGKGEFRTTLLPSPPTPLSAADIRQLRDTESDKAQQADRRP